eukprot:237154-Rhodomonas_salina.2
MPSPGSAGCRGARDRVRDASPVEFHSFARCLAPAPEFQSRSWTWCSGCIGGWPSWCRTWRSRIP